MPKYYGYEAVIKDAFLKLFDSVILLFENVDCLYRYGSIGKRFKSAWEAFVNQYYRAQVKLIDCEVDVVIIIRGSTISNSIFELLKMRFPNAEFILYEWDSVANLPNARALAAGCDSVCTFDPLDAERESWRYLPLFYHSTTPIGGKRDIDIAFVGAMHTDRALILRQLTEICAKKKWCLFSYLYSGGTKFGTCLREHVLNRNSYSYFRNEGDLHFEPLPLHKMNQIYSRTRVVVDYAHPSQSGLTMRSIECLGHSCKLVTNNPSVFDADFYNSSNVHVYNNFNLILTDEFILAPFDPVDKKIVEGYSVECWARKIVGE